VSVTGTTQDRGGRFRTTRGGGRSGRRPPDSADGPVAGAEVSSAPHRSASTWVERVVAGPRPAGRRGRFGLVWFVVAAAAAAIGLLALALVFAAVAGVAALQTVAAWTRDRKPPVQLVAGAVAVALPLAAAFGIALVGALTLVAVAAALVAAMLADLPARRARRAGRPPVLALAGLTLRCGLFPGLVAASAVLVARTDTTAFFILLILVSVYEVGSYLVGTGAASRVEGPLAGMAAAMVLTFALSVFQFGPFDSTAAWVFGGLVVVTAPLGPIVASTLAPDASVAGPGLRRLDSWMLAAPLWAWMLWGYMS